MTPKNSISMNYRECVKRKLDTFLLYNFRSKRIKTELILNFRPFTLSSRYKKVVTDWEKEDGWQVNDKAIKSIKLKDLFSQKKDSEKNTEKNTETNSEKGTESGTEKGTETTEKGTEE